MADYSISRQNIHILVAEDERSPPRFDIILDTTLFSDPGNNSAGHIGHHVSIIEGMADNKMFKGWWDGFVKDYSDIPSDQPTINILIVCPNGAERCVAGSEILRYILMSKGFAVPREIRHLSKHRWNNHISMCRECMAHRQQRRWNEVMEKAVRKASFADQS